MTERSSDEHVLDKATQAGVMVVTGDKRFTETHIPLCRHEGIVKFNVKPAARLRAMKKFLRTKERHLAWKGVAYLFEDQVVIHQHNGEQLSVPYLK